MRAHELPEFFGAANITIKASSDDGYRGLIRDIRKCLLSRSSLQRALG